MGKIKLCLVVLALFGLTSLVSTTATDWWEDSSLYQIYPRSFKDSDGNGIGDINGITDELDYLKEIGITATWLSPIFKSPMVDNGYDISNFTDIDPIFGTLRDFFFLVQKAKQIGVKLILDFVPNHSSDECEWFQKSINREDGYEDFYVWADGKDDPENPGQKLPPSNWVSLFGGSMWTWNEKRQQFYLHQFYAKQPDLNFRNKQVREKMLEVLKFWLDRGVDGFRIDAVPHMFEQINEDGSFPDEDPNNQIVTINQNETVELLYEWREYLDSYRKENGGDTRVLLAEAYSSIEMLDKYMGNGTHHGVQIPFNFGLMIFNTTTNAKEVETIVNQWMSFIWKKHQTANWVTGNHDIGRILNRVGENKKDLVNFLLIGLPGVTVTYYGEEIGMSDVEICQNCTTIEQLRSFGRTPFQWNDELSAGFSSSNETWLPVADDYKTVNVKNQRTIPRSTLNIFKALQQLKNTSAFKAFKNKGGFSYKAITDNVFQIVRRSRNEEYQFLINFGENVEEVGKLITSWWTRNNLMEYTVVSQKSPHLIGEKVKLGKINLMPFEGIVLKKIYKH